MKRKPSIILNFCSIVVLFVLAACSSTEQAELELWYNQPAEIWEEALPIGNGRLGAMVYGTPAKEHLQFNEETLWDCGPRAYQRDGAANRLEEIRALINDGKQREAEELANKVFMGKRAYEDEYPVKKSKWLSKINHLPELIESLQPNTDDREWAQMNINNKSVWETKGLPDLNGCLVFRKTVDIPNEWKGKDLILNMGKIKDHDFTYFNGIKIGEIDGNSINRIYTIPGKLVKAGENKLAVQIVNYEKTGGFNAVRTGYKKMHLTPQGKDEPIFIEGIWKYNIIDTQPPSAPQYQANYQPFGDLWIEFKGHENVENYRRSLDLNKAIVHTTYTLNEVTFNREYLASNPDQTIAIHLTADERKALSFEIYMDSPHPQYKLTYIDKNTFSLNLRVNNGEMSGAALLKIKLKGGNLSYSSKSNKITVQNSSDVTIKLVAATNYVDYTDVSADPVKKSKKYLHSIKSKSYKNIKQDHITDYQNLFNRFNINLGGKEKQTLPTNERIKGIKTTADNDLAALYIQYSRYLMISSGRAGTNPPNLQGIWNKDLFPAWGSKYTTNINCEMNFWGVETLNLPECHQSLFSMIDELLVEGSKTAKVHYNANGWVHHHNTDQWRGTAPINNSNHGIWPTGSAWLAHHYWEHFQYSGDTAFFVQRGLPVIKEAARFFTEVLVEDPKTGFLISSPSNSPENGGLVAGPTMDHQIIRSLFKIAIQANNMLKPVDSEFSKLLKEKLEKIAPYQIGQYGQLQEWMQDIDDPNNKHRHVSHLWGVHPGNEMNWESNPELMDAAKQSLIMRGDEGTGWSLAWKINFWARFLDGEHAHKMVQMLLAPANDPERNIRGGSYPNLFDAHPPFQIDGNFGGAAGMIEMLMQSHQGYIELLPALPTQWKDGNIKGLRARGGFEIEMKWKDGKVEKLSVLSKNGNLLRLKYNGEFIKRETKAGDIFEPQL